ASLQMICRGEARLPRADHEDIDGSHDQDPRITRSGPRSSLRRSWALTATTIVERDMRIAPTDIGSTKPIGASTPAASGTETRLYPAAHHRFCVILRKAARESSNADRTARGSSLARITPADAMATSVPAPMAR